VSGGEENDGLRPLADLDPVIHAQARLAILSYLYVLESADYVFLMRMTGLTWGNLATHLGKLEEAGYVSVEKTFQGKKPQSTLKITDRGRAAFNGYRKSMQAFLDELPG